MNKIAVSSGDPAGIGPDICIKAFGQKKAYDFFPVIFGDKEIFVSRAKQLGIKVDIQKYNGEGKENLSLITRRPKKYFFVAAKPQRLMENQ